MRPNGCASGLFHINGYMAFMLGTRYVLMQVGSGAYVTDADGAPKDYGSLDAAWAAAATL